MKEYIFIIVMSILVSACATIGNPDGGPLDTEGPVLIMSESSKNFVTHWNGESMTLVFDEYIKVDNPASNMVVSPPLRYPIDIRLKNKKAKVSLDEREELLENTSYVFNFANAIQDLNESNPAKDLIYVFSTGAYIDSLTLHGAIEGIEKRDSMLADIPILLYDDLQDSAFYLSKPFYLSYSDSLGHFHFDYLKPDTFRIFALEDQNGNLQYDGPPERIAFLDRLVILPTDSILTKPLILFEEEAPLFVDDYSFHHGRLTLTLNRNVLDTPQINFIGLDPFHIKYRESEIDIWYTGDLNNQIKLIIEEGDQIDTTKLRYVKSKDMKRSKPSIVIEKKIYGEINQGILRSETPIASWDSLRIQLQQDTVVTPLEILAQPSPFELLYALPNLTPGVFNRISIPEGSITFFDDEVIDSTFLSLNTPKIEDLGQLYISIENLDSSMQYVYEILNRDEKVLKSEVIINNTKFMDTLINIVPGTYHIKIIQDSDRNMRWTSGNWLKRRAPEKIFYEALTPVKANWEIESKIKPIFVP